MTTPIIHDAVARYYSAKVREHGPTFKGVDWNSPESQRLRFQQILRICEGAATFSINDFGCGYGALIEELERQGGSFEYCGFDISAEMLERAFQAHAGRSNCRFVSSSEDLPAADFTVASGIFNVKLDTSPENWLAYILETLDQINEKSAMGLAFNALTSYSDPDYKRDDLF